MSMASAAETAYGTAGDRESAIRQLVVSHLPLVKHIVSQIDRSGNGAISTDDLISAGTVGLVEAAHRYDPSQNTKFVTFAYRRVKGAVIDCLRQGDWLGRSARTHLRAIREHIDSFRSRTGRKPTIGELERESGMSEQDLLKYLSYEKWDYVGSLQDTVRGAEGEDSVLSALIPGSDEGPLQKLEWKERVELLAQAVQALSDVQKQIIVMYYYEDLYIAEVAAVLQVSESRVSQLHTRALYNLSRMLEQSNG